MTRIQNFLLLQITRQSRYKFEMILAPAAPYLLGYALFTAAFILHLVYFYLLSHLCRQKIKKHEAKFRWTESNQL